MVASGGHGRGYFFTPGMHIPQVVVEVAMILGTMSIVIEPTTILITTEKSLRILHLMVIKLLPKHPLLKNKLPSPRRNMSAF